MRAMVCGIAISLATGAIVGQDSGAPDPFPGLSPRARAVVGEVCAQLAALPTDLRLVAAVPDLENRYGRFHDMDGDGELDYVATEMRHGREEVVIHRRSDRGWQMAGRIAKGFEQKHPLVPWVIDDLGDGRPAVVLPVGWPPHLYLLRTNGRCDFAGAPIPIGEALPERLSAPAGVDNCPFEVTACHAARNGSPARIEGRMEDEEGARRLALAFTLVIDADGPRCETRPLSDGGTPLGDIPLDFAPVRSVAHCGHESDERHAIVATEIADVTADGIDDLVLLSGVLSGHVFPGRLEGGSLSFGGELGTGRDVPIEDLRFWFPVGLRPDGPSSPFAGAARARLDRMGFRVAALPGVDAAFTTRTDRRKGWLLNHYWTDDGMVPVVDHRSFWPARDGVGELSERWRGVAVFDADHDATADVLSVHVGQEYEWLKPPPAEGGFLPDGYTREIRPGTLRAGIVHGLGEHGDAANRVLWFGNDGITIPDNPHLGMPITLERVPTPTGERWCVLLRDRRLGLFFEVGDPPDEDGLAGRRYEAWIRRGERRLESHELYWTCDRRLCPVSGPRHHVVFADAEALFRRALDFAVNTVERGRVHRHLARCASRRGDLESARRAYERFVALTRTVEPLARPHPDLAALFADEAFRELHDAWVDSVTIVPAGSDRD